MIRQMVVMACLLQAAAVPAAAQDAAKAWIDLNFGTATAAEDEYSSTRVIVVDREAGAGSVVYGLPRGASFDVGGGYMFHPRVGAGVSLAGTAHEDSAGLGISVPHPIYFGASAVDGTETDGVLTRAEGAWHVHAMLVAVDTSSIRVRVFGGPSYFRAEQDVVSSIGYDQVYQVFGRGNEVDITSYRSETSVGTAWGAHVGADIAVFFNRVFGLGAMFRVSRATTDIDDYGGEHAVKVGGVQLGGGLRFRF